MSNYVYFFGANRTEGNGHMKELLGGKGSGLAEMAQMGIPVPPGFTITTEVCSIYQDEKKYPDEVKKQIFEAIEKLEDATDKKFGDNKNPLLLSIRSGARVSMPGMMDTVLNLGLNDVSVEGLAEKTENPRFAYDCYRRFVAMFADVVLNIEYSKFEKVLEETKKAKNIENDTELTVEDLKELVESYKKIVCDEKNFEFPQNPEEQLFMAISAVFESWNNPRAEIYRSLNNIPGDWGTAVNVQSMVYGNMGETSGTGVAFTRDPSTGENRFFGEYLINAQGEDVVAGIRTPSEINTLKEKIPRAYEQLVDICEKLESHFADMQDIEFTIQEGELYMLQTRAGKRTAASATKIAVDMVKEGLVDRKTALMRISPDQINQLLHPTIDPKAKLNKIGKGLPASPGAAVGKVVFTPKDAEDMKENGIKTILVRLETSPDDIGGMHAAEGILTARGGMTSHAAVVGRGMGKPCVVGCGEIIIDDENKQFTLNGNVISQGDDLTIDGGTGDVIKGAVPLIDHEIDKDIIEILSWADEFKKIGVYANADTPEDVARAIELGAEGIGLCRTEHMFFDEERIPVVRAMVLADSVEERKKHLGKILPMQKEDFKEILRLMEGKTVTIRLLDPPLHEFLPNIRELEKDLAKLKLKNAPKEELMRIQNVMDRVNSLQEVNPMLGHRGCRLGITYPEIYNMQTRAVFEAACELKKDGVDVIPEIMVPLVGEIGELEITKKEIIRVAKETLEKYDCEIPIVVGTMIELPRAVMTADKIAKEADFFSFGTNDLTQTTFGFSRDDVAKFIPEYIDKNILKCDPFSTIDVEGVGELMKIGVNKGRSTKPELKIGICGEHGGDPASIRFAEDIGIDYVSCSSYRVPIARLVAAQNVIEKEQNKN
ncbi:MAG: pyruvate, phosphate dikinase [Methanosarcinaceae archaeon]|nr:pyruvate, phosphate dikinase [Methanosarcinaceae archaeon]